MGCLLPKNVVYLLCRYRLLGSGTWSVFADEHEAIRSLGIPSNLNWVPADENAWTYAAANDDWNFDSSTDPVK